MIDDFHKIQPYSLEKAEKEQLLLRELNQITRMHRSKCAIYANYLNAIGYGQELAKTLYEIPFVPIRIFKELEVKSIPDEDVFKIMMSSGTGGQVQSKIYLNKENAILQQKVLLRLLGDFVGTKRLPMLVVDSRSMIRDRRLFTTRGATIMGLDFMAKRMVFALDDDMTLNADTLMDFVKTYGDDKFIIFGFTFMIWQHLFHELERRNLESDIMLITTAWRNKRDASMRNVNTVISTQVFIRMLLSETIKTFHPVRMVNAD